MHSVHWYSYCWIGILLLHILSRRVFWIKRCLSKFPMIPNRFIDMFYLKQDTSDHFPQDASFNLGFLILALTSNTLALFLFPGSSILEAVTDRVGPLVLVNLTALFLLSFRHSIYIELAAAYQPVFLWAHQALGTITIAQVVAYFGLEFRGMLISPSQEFKNLRKRDFARQWPILIVRSSHNLEAWV